MVQNVVWGIFAVALVSSAFVIAHSLVRLYRQLRAILEELYLQRLVSHSFTSDGLPVQDKTEVPVRGTDARPVAIEVELRIRDAEPGRRKAA